MSPPDLDALLGFYALRAVSGVEAVDVAARTYTRAVGGRAVTVDGATLTDAGAAGSPAVPGADDAAARLARCVAGSSAEAAAAEAHLIRHPVLGPLVRAAPGLRVPGHPDGAELAVRAVLGQQVSVEAARTIAGRLTASLGEPLAEPTGSVDRSFPASAALAALDPGSLPMPRSRGRALVGLAVALAAGDVDLRADADPVLARDSLLELWGIGPWTADYVLMRALRVPDVLLVGDLGVKHALRAVGFEPSATALRQLAEEVAPFGSYATIHLWHSLSS